MQFERKTESDVVVLSVKGDPLGEEDAFALRQKIYGLINGGITHVVLDLAGVHHINSAGLGGIISSMITLRKAGGDLYLAEIGENVQGVLKITHLTEVFRHYKTIEEAKAGFH